MVDLRGKAFYQYGLSDHYQTFQLSRFDLETRSYTFHLKVSRFDLQVSQFSHLALDMYIFHAVQRLTEITYAFSCHFSDI